MMYIEHTNLEDNLHHILTNREPTSSSPSASEATAAVAASALLARVREAQNSASSSLQQQTTSANAQYQNNYNNSSTPNNNKTSLEDLIRRSEETFQSLNHITSNGLTNELREILKTVEKNNSTSALKKQAQENHQNQSKTEEEDVEQYELLQVVDSDQTGQAEHSKSFKFANNVEQKEIENSPSTSHFLINTNGANIASNTSRVPTSATQVQIDDDEDFEYVVTRVPKRKLRHYTTSQPFEDYTSFNRKLRRPVPEAIPIDFYPKRTAYNEFQPPTSQFERPIPSLKRPYNFASQKRYQSSSDLNGCAATDFQEDEENNCDYYSDSEAASTGVSAYAYSHDFYTRQQDQMGLDIISKLKQLFSWHPSTNQYSSDFQQSKRKRRSDDWSAGETAGPHEIKYRKVENRFPKYISARPEEDDINEFLPPFSHHNQQKSQKYDKQYILNNSAQSSKTLLEMSNHRSTALDKPPLRKSMFSAPHITQQLIKNTTYADVEFSDDDDEPNLLKNFHINPTTLATGKRVPQVYNIPIIRTDERLKSKVQKPPPPPLIEPATGSILQSSLIPVLENRRKPTYAEALRQNSAAGHVLGNRNSNTPSVASTSQSSRMFNGLRTNPWSTQNRSSILNQEKQSEEREKYQQLLEQVVPRLYGSATAGAENKFSAPSTSNFAAQRRKSALLLGTGLQSSARSTPPVNNRSMGIVPSFLKRPPLSSTINLDDEESEEDVIITGASYLKNSRASKAKPISVIVDDDEISDIIDLENEERHVLSACAKIQKEKSLINNLGEEKVVKPKKDDLPFVEPVNSLQERFNASPHIKDNWLENFQSKWSQRKKNRNDEVTETVKVTEKLTAERRAAEAEIQERLRKFQIVDPELLVIDDFEDVLEEPEFVELTTDHRNRINAALHGGPLDQVLVSKFNLNISRRHIQTLWGDNWLNDEVINFYMNLLTERGEKRSESHGLPKVYAMNTFFIPRLMQAGHDGVKRWTRRVDIFEKDIIPVPVHVGKVHWCMAIIHLKERSIKYYDSMGTPNPTVLKALEQYLKAESKDKRNQTFDTTGFTIESVQGVPRQGNGSDCGVFSCMFAEYITRNREITFSQKNMAYFREKMILEIVTGELLQ